MATFNRYVLCLLGLVPAYGWSAEVRLTVAEPSGVARSSWPVTSGIPLGRRALRDPDRVALFDGQGKPLPLQTDVLTRWPDVRSAGCCSTFRSTFARMKRPC